MLRRLALAVALLGVLLAACTDTNPSPSATTSGPQKVTVGPETQRELEALLAKKADAARRQDLAAYQSTVDLSRSTFRRCVMEGFDEAGRGSGPAWITATRIVKVEPYLDTYVRAYVEESGLGIARRYFRKDGANWILSEPKDDELGAEKKKTVDGLDLSYWAIDEDLADMLAQEGLATRTFLLANAHGQTRTPFALRFFPSRASAGLQAACRVLGTSQINDPRDPYLRFFGVWLAPSLKAVSDDMRATFKHEGLHWLQDQFIPGISARLDWWMVEGWPDYVGGVDRSSAQRRVLCGSITIPTYKNLTDGPPQAPGTPPETASQYYAYANSMVEYLYSKFGKDAYWDLMTAYRPGAGVDPNVNLPAVIKVTPQQFYDGWLAFAKKKIC